LWHSQHLFLSSLEFFEQSSSKDSSFDPVVKMPRDYLNVAAGFLVTIRWTFTLTKTFSGQL
jgi:hypothetical protein